MQLLFYSVLLLMHRVCGLPTHQKSTEHVGNVFTSDFRRSFYTPNKITLDNIIKGFGLNYYSVIDPEVSMSIGEMIRYHGYPFEEHEVVTEDGYILKIHRVPFGKIVHENIRRKPVLVQHGLLCSSAAWVCNTPDKNLPYILADAGYDVWIGNVRGTLFGRKHKYLSPESKEFWSYSFQEMAKYDIPAVINTMLKVTGFKNIYYVGHSMGTMIAFALLSSQPKYNEIIKGVFAMAPVSAPVNSRSPLGLLAPFSHEMNWISDLLGTREILNNNNLIKFLSTTVCITPFKFLCENVLFISCGYSKEQLNSTRLPVYLHHTPAATSAQNIIHIAQLMNSKKFQYFDYGIHQNKVLYGQRTPPEYNLKTITTPIALFWSENDLLADPRDVSLLATQLPSLILKYKVKHRTFSHLDFMWAIDVKPLLYDELLKVMKKPSLWRD